MFSTCFSDAQVKELKTAITGHAKGASLSTTDLDAMLADVESLVKTAKDNLLNPVKSAAGPSPKKPG